MQNPNPNIKVQVTISDVVSVRIEHDTINGSAITATADNLADALIRLGESIKQTKVKDSIWHEI